MLFRSVDTAFSFVRRVMRGQPFSMADKDHLHHRLMRLGHGPRRTVVILWLWTALLSGLALIPAYTNEGNALVPVGVVALALLLYAFFFPGKREARASTAVEPEGPESGVDGAADQGAEKAAVIDLEARRRRTGA